ncbi:nuclear transport factor 2 family protein [Sphingomonas sp. UV9]|uniref:nuclear transport factor 2 family protein n=1 Tax=Sphingomonas sp. UV9 TaxID=1851410 RepID=UPI000FFBC6E6|nr:nuclear transport factor 2 family protein [Sphingomonas sp. UV9]RXD04816.1 nuclear transport factor 2 family protein [Sphingomonas sp. UV9]
MSKPTYVDDYALIATTLKKYTEGLVAASGSDMRPAFAKEATVFSVENGILSGGPAEGLFANIDEDFEASLEARVAITRVEIVGSAASARIDINDVNGFYFSDFIHLLKVEGAWTIVGKIFYTHA